MKTKGYFVVFGELHLIIVSPFPVLTSNANSLSSELYILVQFLHNVETSEFELWPF